MTSDYSPTVLDKAQRLGVRLPGVTAPVVEKQPAPRRPRVTQASPRPTREGEYSAREVCRATGATYRQLDYWDRTGVVSPSLQASDGSGSLRFYSENDVSAVRVVVLLLDAGLSLRHAGRCLVERSVVSALEPLQRAQQRLDALDPEGAT